MANIKISTRLEYKTFVKTTLAKKFYHKPELKQQFQRIMPEILPVYLLDFDPIADLLRGLYSQKKVGKHPYDPQVFLRSLFLMLIFKYTINSWVQKLKEDLILRVFCGFEGKAPSVGAHYDFLKRLENGCYQPPCAHRILPSEQRKAQALAEKSPQNKPIEPIDQHKEQGVILQLTQLLKKQRSQPVSAGLEQRLNEILLLVAVAPSIEKNYILEPEKLVLAGDGSVIPSASNENGKPLCNCRKQGIYKCEHPRKFTDSHAAWGWDNREKTFIFGHRFTHLVYGSNGHDLPIYILIDSANTHEVKLTLLSIDHLQKMLRRLLPFAFISKIALDALYDMYAVYHYLADCGIKYAIPYKEEPAKCISLGKDQQLFNKNGKPFCPGGEPMRLHGTDKQNRKVYACPIKRLAHVNGKKQYVTHAHECPLGSICEPESSIGPIIHVDPNIDLRIHPAIPRDSQEFKELSNLRSSCERSNSMKKCRFGMKQPRTRIMPIAYTYLAFISVLEHSKVWAKDLVKSVNFSQVDPLNFLSSLG